MKWITIQYLIIGLLSLVATAFAETIPSYLDENLDLETRLEAFARDPSIENRIVLGVGLHDQARIQNKEKAAEEAVEVLKPVLDETPNNAVAMAYLGSSYALWGRETGNVVNKVRYVNRGTRFLDRAVELAPEDFTVRMVSANVNNQLPVMFRRGKKATADLQALDALFSAEPSPFKAKFMTDIYQILIKRAEKERDSEAVTRWRNKQSQARMLITN